MDFSKIFNGRIKCTSDSTEHWEVIERSFKPLSGEVIIYNDYFKEEIGRDGATIFYKYIPAIKIGDNEHYLHDLEFLNRADQITLEQHINNNQVHVTQAEKEFWNNKLNYSNSELNVENLIFNRN